MIVLKIGKEQFKIPESRNEVTIRQILQFYQDVEPHQPPSLKRIAKFYLDSARIKGRDIAENVKADKIADLEEELNNDLDILTEKESPDQFYRYYAKVLSFFCGAPEEILLQVRIKDLEKFHGLLLKLINDHQPDIEFSGFEFKGEKYVLPARLPIPMEDSTLIEFLEAEQYKHYYHQLEETQGKDEQGFDVRSHYNALLPIICIVSRKENEPYYDNIVRDRSELFLDLPLNIADQVFFYLMRWKIISTKITSRLSEIGSNLKTLQPEPEN